MSPLEANKGLLRQPDSVHWQQTGGYRPGSDEYRQFRAKELGLPDNSTWGEIGEFLNRQDMIAVAKSLDFTEEQIGRLSWRSILFEGILGLGGNEPIELIIEQIQVLSLPNNPKT